MAFGPIAAFNVLSLLAPALSAYGAFLLCRYLSGSWSASLLGGYIFGFSDFVLGEVLGGGLNLTLLPMAPFAALVVARALSSEISQRRFTVELTAILVVQFLIFIEVFATLTMFGAIALVLGWIFAPPEMRHKLKATSRAIAFSYSLTAVILSPFIYWLFAYGWPRGEIWPNGANIFSGGLLDFLTTSRLSLVVIAIAYVSSHWRTRLGKALAVFLVIISVLVLGPRLHIADRVYFELPGKFLLLLPLLDKALPIRFIIYWFLCLSVITSVWISSNRFGGKMNLIIGFILIVLLRPDFGTQWVKPFETPAFFSTTSFRRYLKLGENVLVLPFGFRGPSMLWQAETGMYFRMAGGYTGPSPAEYTGWPMMGAFNAKLYLPDAANQLGAFLQHHDVSVAVVADSDQSANFWESLLSQFSIPKISTGGVTIYRMIPPKLEMFRGVTALQMRQRAESAAIDTLIRAAAQWISASYAPSQLTASRAVERGFLKAAWCPGPTEDVFTGEKAKSTGSGLADHWFCGVWLGATPEGRTTIGIYGTYDELEPALAELRGKVSRIYFPYPRDLLAPGTSTPPPNARGLMQVVFSREQLIAADAKLVKELR
ncbi:MAG TPA: hypothetical protein VMT58_01070, partial [Candidatus Binataceae bacterium]|nr:hypothetical protein [Candidatus Binataceae bacterium]